MDIKYLNLEYFYYHAYRFLMEGVKMVTGKAFGGSLPPSVAYISGTLSLLFAAGIIYNLWKLFKLRKKHIGEYAKIITEAPQEERVTQWDFIKKRLNSENPSDWSQAILEADSLVDGIIKKIGYRGETFGERLANITPVQFKCINELWEAHKVRNRIAHEGTKFELTKNQAGQVIGLYEKALEEMEYV